MSPQRPDSTEATYRTLFERAPVGIVYADARSTYLDANAAICKMFGYTREEFIGLNATDIIVPDEAAEIDSALREIHDDRPHEREWRFKRKDGSTFLAHVTATKFADGTLLGMIQDVSALREHERELERISRLYAALSRINRAIVFTSTRDELFREVCRVLVEDGGMRMAWIGWHDPATRHIAPVAQWGDESDYLSRINVSSEDGPDGRGPTGIAVRAGYPHIVNDLLNEPRSVPWLAEMNARGFRSSAAFPIRLGGETVGALSVYAGRAGAFRAKEVGLLLEAAQNIAFAIENFAREEARRAAEETLRQEQRFSDTMIESMPGVLYFYDEAGRFIRWNRNLELVTGYTGEEIAQMHPTDLFAPGEKERVADRIAEVFASGESGVEAYFTRPDGVAVPFYFTGRRVTFQERTCLVGVGIDISERLRAEAQLRESEARLLEAQRLAQLGSWEYDPVPGTVLLSDQLREMLGLGAASARMDHQAFLAMAHPDDRERIERARGAVLAGTGRADLEYRVARTDGTELVFDETSAVRHDAQGKVVALAGIVHDVTDRARVAAERERRDRAEAADRIKSAFLATMSHELRTPLNSIIGFTGILIQGLAGPLNEEQQRQLDMVRGSARHLLALVNDVLDISKIEAGQLDVGRHRFDVAATIERVMATVRPQAEAKGLALHASLAPGLAELVSDERRFEQILFNLLSNAIKFTERGTVNVEAEPVAADGASGRADGAVRVRVRDTGIGIRADDLASLFQPFRQLEVGLARSHEGTGLGLAICRRLAALMGGTVSVESALGKGSTFTVILPREGAHA
jgi:PAS domain S-box-containing protein